MSTPIEPAFEWLQCRLFVSSTFGDFAAERELLVRTVMPRLRERLVPHRVEIADIDLRWGITREAVENGDAAALCLDAVSDCQPFFVGFLGDYYGNPTGAIPAVLRDRHAWLDAEERRSLTDLEMTAALQQPGLAVFCLRSAAILAEIPTARRPAYSSSAPDRRALLEDLGRRIASCGTRTIRYSAEWDPVGVDPFHGAAGTVRGLEELAQHLGDTLYDLIVGHYGPRDLCDRIDPHASFDAAHARVAEELTRGFVGRVAELADLRALLERGVGRPIAIVGEPGIGKSSLAARLAQDLTAARGFAVFTHFFGADEHALSLQNLSARLIRHAVRLGADAPGPASIRQAMDLSDRDLLLRTVAALPTGTRHLLVLDGIEAIGFDDRTGSLAGLPREVPAHVSIVVTIDRPVEDAAIRTADGATVRVEPADPTGVGPLVASVTVPDGFATYGVNGLSPGDSTSLVERHLSLAARALSRSDTERCVRANPTGSPLALRAMLEVLRWSRSVDHLESMLTRIGAAVGHHHRELAVAAPFALLLERTAEDAGSAAPYDIAMLLRCARSGLSERELARLCGLSDGDPAVALTLTRLRPFLSTARDQHRARCGSIEVACTLRSRHARSEAHQRLADYFAAYPLSDRKAIEYHFHLASNAETRARLLPAMLADPGLLRRAQQLDPGLVRACIVSAVSVSGGIDTGQVLSGIAKVADRWMELGGQAENLYLDGNFIHARMPIEDQLTVARLPFVGHDDGAATALADLTRVAIDLEDWPEAFARARQLHDECSAPQARRQHAETLALGLLEADRKDEREIARHLLAALRSAHGVRLDGPAMHDLEHTAPTLSARVRDVAAQHDAEDGARAGAARFDAELRPILRPRSGKPRLLWIDRYSHGRLAGLQRAVEVLSEEFDVEIAFSLGLETVRALELVIAREPATYAAILTHAPALHAATLPGGPPPYALATELIRRIRNLIDVPVLAYTGANIREVPWSLIHLVDALVIKTVDADADARTLRSRIAWAVATDARRPDLVAPVVHRRGDTLEVEFRVRLTGGVPGVAHALIRETTDAGRGAQLRRSGAAEEWIELGSILATMASGIESGEAVTLRVEGTDRPAERHLRRIYSALTSRFPSHVRWHRFESTSPRGG